MGGWMMTLTEQAEVDPAALLHHKTEPQVTCGGIEGQHDVY